MRILSSLLVYSERKLRLIWMTRYLCFIKGLSAQRVDYSLTLSLHAGSLCVLRSSTALSPPLSLYSHIIERLGERTKQDSQYCIRHLLVYLIPLTPVLVIFVLHHKMATNNYSTRSKTSKVLNIFS